MQRYVMDHLHDPELGPEQIAQAHFVSTRYVHKLFAASGTGVSAWIRERRFEGAVDELRRSPETTIATVATRWGYRNPGKLQPGLPRGPRLRSDGNARQLPALAGEAPRPDEVGRGPSRTMRGQACGKPASRRRVPQIPDLPGAMIPFGSRVSLIVSLKRRSAWSLKPNWSAARSMKDKCARYSP